MESTKVFRFGDGELRKPDYAIEMVLKFGGLERKVLFHVVEDATFPALLALDDMKRWGMDMRCREKSGVEVSIAGKQVSSVERH